MLEVIVFMGVFGDIIVVVVVMSVLRVPMVVSVSRVNILVGVTVFKEVIGLVVLASSVETDTNDVNLLVAVGTLVISVDVLYVLLLLGIEVVVLMKVLLGVGEELLSVTVVN